MADTPDVANAALEGADMTDAQAVRDGALDDGESWSERAAREVGRPQMPPVDDGVDPVDAEIARLDRVAMGPAGEVARASVDAQIAAIDQVADAVARCREIILASPDSERHVVMQRLRYEFGG